MIAGGRMRFIKTNKNILILMILVCILRAYFPYLYFFWFVALAILTLIFIFRSFSYAANEYRTGMVGKRVSLTSPTTGDRVTAEIMGWTAKEDEVWIKTEKGETIFIPIRKTEESKSLNLKFLN